MNKNGFVCIAGEGISERLVFWILILYKYSFIKKYLLLVCRCFIKVIVLFEVICLYIGLLYIIVIILIGSIIVRNMFWIVGDFIFVDFFSKRVNTR